MNVNDQLIRIRRFLRDPNKRIWSDDFLLNIFNDIHEEIQNETNILQQVTVVKIPPSYRWSYLHDWEYAYIPTTETGHFQALRQHQQADQVYCFEWELQQTWEITPDVTAAGAMFIHPWEAWYLNPDDAVEIPFPADFRNTIFIAYDKDPIDFMSRKTIQEDDSSYLTTTGTPVYYYRPDEFTNRFVLYPRPTAANWSDGDGIAFFNDGDDQLDNETGFSVRRTYSGFNSNEGVDLDIPLVDDNVFLVYSVNPLKLQISDTSPYPRFLRKYIEYGVISRAYKANTDGRIPTLGEFWGLRYDYGRNIIKQYMLKRRADRVYRLGPTRFTRRNKHPRLPATYPNVNPL